MTAKVLMTSKPLSFRQALTILEDISVSYGIFEEDTLITMVNAPRGGGFPPIREICQVICQRNVDTLVRNILRCERQDRKGERRHQDKMKSWSLIQRRRLLSGHRRYLKSQWTLHEQYLFFYQEIEACNPVYPRGSRGPAQRYSRTGITAAIALKMVRDIQWMDLPAELRGTGIDMRLPSRKHGDINPVPSHQLFFSFFKKMPENELQKLLRLTDSRSQAKLESFKGQPVSLLYASDGSGHPLQEEEPCEWNGKPSFRRKSTHLVLTQNLRTRTIRHLFYPELTDQSRRDIRDAMNTLPPGAVLLGDREFDVEYLQAEARACNVTLHARPNLQDEKPARSPLRRQAHLEFDKQVYRKRKTNESIFAILKKRGVLLPRRVTVKLSAKATLWACVGHNLDARINLEIDTRIFKYIKHPVLEQAVDDPGKISQPAPTCYHDGEQPITALPEMYQAMLEGKTAVHVQKNGEPVNSSGNPATVDSLRSTDPETVKQKEITVKTGIKTSSSDSLAVPIKMLLDKVAILILGFLYQQHPAGLTRTSIYQVLGLQRTTTHDALQRLVIHRLVQVKTQVTGHRGRPPRFYSLYYPASDRGPPCS